ncbi:phosphatidylserine/phosphatidylglycerophosphate/cardiolipin synthase-like enzyme [Archangium gephyra]|uniref:Phosphatidylserine/phosphatidylglycerophosphate/ cardiolipin synthase n=1 Tax=Archangium gephyra TaxID=48 RepID=A0AAC8Q218_9BACT|nr:phospholipase D-like domain-containing protein [Archangium gephyra]AKI99410.1 Phosphatidylserine/phosphatidylglycerophosphate/cardiolipin synthase [Archangium gephyra]REG28043.1 phosphatidylserine/phosphatidylglycerophosphate/cardiolipin synthase-like enzyme [Archangium gephyra]
MPLRWILPLVPFVLSLACAAPAPALRATASEVPGLELVESSPVETTLDHADIPDAWQVWPEMVNGATRTLDVAQFYVSNAPGSRLEPVIGAIEAAADRGVKVRVLAEEKFYKQYPETLERLAKRPGVEVRRLDTAKVFGGGVLHAKYFVVDGREAYLGSQNFDWRALEHIQELGLRLRVPEVVRSLADIFEQDWALAVGAQAPATAAVGGPFPASYAGSTVRVTPAHSPEGHLPDPATWDLPKLVKLIDGAKRSVRVQLLTYKAKSRDGGPFPELEDALKRAAGRGVKVELLVADWGKRKGTIEGLQALQSPPGLTVKLVTIPQWSGGFIPFARVVHAKYMVVDGERAWLGTSNWERDYFTQSRNVGVIVEGEAFAARLERFFQDTWASPYAAEVDPKAAYTAPDISGTP